MAKFDRNELFDDQPRQQPASKIDRASLFDDRPNPAADMSAGQRFLAGAVGGVLEGAGLVKNALNDAAVSFSETGIGQAVDRFGQRLGLPYAADVKARNDAGRTDFKRTMQPLKATTAGKAGSIPGNVATVLPTAFIPGANTYLGAALIGAVTGAALSETNDRLGGAAFGAAGGAAGKFAGDKLLPIVMRQIGNIRQAVSRGMPADEAATVAINNALRQNGLSLADVPEQARAGLLKEVSNAIKIGVDIDAAALARKADFVALGATPTTGTITRDPQKFAFEQTLRGVKDVGDDLAGIYNQNNRVLIERLNQAGAANAPGRLNTGRSMTEGLSGYAAAQQRAIDALYGQAKNSAGRAADLDPAYFANTVGDSLDRELKNAFLPGEIRKMVNDFATGAVPLNVNSAEQFKTILATAQRGSQDGNVKAALGLVREAIDSTPLLPTQQAAQASIPGALPSNLPSAQVGGEAIEAFNKARAATRTFKQQTETTPALKAVVDGIEPDKFFDRHVMGANVADLRKTVNILKMQSPETVAAIRAQVLESLKDKALSGASDEVGNFSQAAFNKALKQLGDERLLAAGLTKADIAQLKLIGRVASYTQAAPAGAVVNRSGTSAQSYNLLMNLIGKAKMVPFAGPMIAEPLSNAVGGLAAKDAATAAIPITQNALMELSRRSTPAIGAMVANELATPKARK